MSESHAAPPSSCPRCQTFLPEPVVACPICGADLTGAAADAPIARAPTELDLVRTALAADYEVLDELGRGGMGVVYRARERRLERDVAIKVLPFARAHEATYVERFMQEARIAAALEHPNIIPIHRVGREEDVIFFAMKLVRGPSLSQLLEQRRTLRPAEIRQLLREVGDALAYAARRGVVHRDIKPDNILQEAESGRYLVSDFGIARSVEAARLTEPGTAVGTPRYMSPEQARGAAVDGRSDIYSLGAVAYHCLVGRPPFEGRDSVATLYAHVHEPLPRPSLTGPDEHDLFAIVERMLAKDPDGRLQTGEDVVRAVTGATIPALDRVSSATTEIFHTGGLDTGGTGPQPGGIVGRLRAGLRRRTAALIAPLLRYRAVRWVTRTPRRAVTVLLASVGLVWGGRTALHLAVMHQSRCPAEVTAPSVLLDPIGSRSLGSHLDVYYDVCGLAKGTPYTVEVALSRKAGGIGGLFGGRDRPLAVTYDEKAHGPATRRHRDIALPQIDPGSYTLAVTVTLDDGQELRREHEVQLLER